MKLLLSMVLLMTTHMASAQVGRTCTWDSDCAQGYRCNNGECRMGRWPDGGCHWDTDCLARHRCVEGECKYDNSNRAGSFLTRVLNPTRTCAR